MGTDDILLGIVVMGSLLLAVIVICAAAVTCARYRCIHEQVRQERAFGSCRCDECLPKKIDPEPDPYSTGSIL